MGLLKMFVIPIPVNNNIKQSLNLKSKLPIYIGLFLICNYLIQDYFDWQLESLYQLQQDFIYKQISGIVFLGLILFQWRLYYRRSTKNTNSIQNIFFSHRFYGAITPLFLYMHSMEIGYALQAMLSICFISCVLSGLFSPNTWGIRAKYYINTWLVFHVMSASCMLGLTVFHVYIVYWYG